MSWATCKHCYSNHLFLRNITICQILSLTIWFKNTLLLYYNSDVDRMLLNELSKLLAGCAYLPVLVLCCLWSAEDCLMTLKYVSRRSVSELQRNSLPASFFYCGRNKVVVMQCHDGEETKGTIWANAIPITWCTHTNYIVFVSDAQNNLKCKQV